MLNVLFYLEPVVFRQHPKLLEPWAHWVAQISKSNYNEIASAVCSNGIVCDLYKNHMGQDAATYELPSLELLEAFGFDRLAYARALYAPRDAERPQATPSLVAVSEQFNPDIVVSFTEAPALSAAFPDATILFTEVGSLPRMGTPQTFFFDPCGHQSKSVMNVRWDDLRLVEPSVSGTEASALLAERVVANDLYPAQRLVRDWTTEQRRRGRIVLIALQPCDWVTHEGLLGARRQEELIFEHARRYPDHIIVPTYHPTDIFREDMENFIQRELSNVIFPPRELAVGFSELFVPYIDTIITVSSNIALYAALLRCHVILLAKAPFSRAVAEANLCRDDPDTHGRLCAVLLTFLSNRYLEFSEKILKEPGYFASVVTNFHNRMEPSDALFDFTDWRIERLRQLLGLPT